MPNVFMITKRGYGPDAPLQKRIVNSEFPLLKVAKQDSGTLIKTAGQNSASVTINHNLGYEPIVYVYGQIINESGVALDKYTEYPFEDTFGLHFYEIYGKSVTTTDLTISFTTTLFVANTISLNYFYFICYDPA